MKKRILTAIENAMLGLFLIFGFATLAFAYFVSVRTIIFMVICTLISFCLSQAASIWNAENND